MAALKINTIGIHELDIVSTGASATIVAPGVVQLTIPGGGTNTTHDEPLTDGNGNFIFAATLTTGGDIIVVIGVAN